MSNKQRIEGLLEQVPKSSEKADKIKNMFNLHQAIMLNLSKNPNTYKPRQELEVLNSGRQIVQPIPIQYNANRHSIQKVKPKNNIKLVSEDELKNLKNEYYNTKESKTELLRSMNIDPLEDKKIALDYDVNRHENKVSLRDKLRSMNRGVKKIPAHRKIKAVLKAAARLVWLQKHLKKEYKTIEEEWLLIVQLDINLYSDVTKGWLLKVYSNLISSVSSI